MAWEKDPRTGIEREVVEPYSASTSMPGAVVVPTNSGQLGGQRNVKLTDSLATVINPGSKDEVKLSTADVIKYMPLAVRMVHNDDPGVPEIIRADVCDVTTKAYKLIALWVKEGKEDTVAKKSDLMTMAQPDGRTRARPYDKKSGRYNEHKAEKLQDRPISTVDATAINTSGVTTARIQSVVPNQPTFPNAVQKSEDVHPALQAVPPDQLAQALAAMMGPAVHAALLQNPWNNAPGHHVPVIDAPHVDPEADILPKVSVCLNADNGASWQCNYHEVIKYNDLLILIYNRDFKYGSRVFPPVDYEKAYKITVIPSDGQQQSYDAKYLGVSFPYQNLDFQVMLIGPSDVEDTDEA